MSPETVLASISALASDGIVSFTDPFTEFSSRADLLRCEKRASKRPLMVESCARPERSLASSLPLMQLARTSPLTPATSSDPLISLISSRCAPRGTVTVYSTLGGLLCQLSLCQLSLCQLSSFQV